MTKEDFEKKLSSLIREFEDINDEIILEFAYFDDNLDKVHSWEGDGFKEKIKPELITQDERVEYMF